MKPVKHPIVIATALLAAGLLSTPASHADPLSDSYNAGYNKGFIDGRISAGGDGGGGIILAPRPSGGFPGATGGGHSITKQPNVGFYWSGMLKQWQAYKLEKNATNTITPGAGLPMSEWAKNPMMLKNYGIDSSTVTPQLEEVSKAIGKNYPNANIWVSPGAKTM